MRGHWTYRPQGKPKGAKTAHLYTCETHGCRVSEVKITTRANQHGRPSPLPLCPCCQKKLYCPPDALKFQQETKCGQARPAAATRRQAGPG